MQPVGQHFACFGHFAAGPAAVGFVAVAGNFVGFVGSASVDPVVAYFVVAAVGIAIAGFGNFYSAAIGSAYFVDSDSSGSAGFVAAAAVVSAIPPAFSN